MIYLFFLIYALQRRKAGSYSPTEVQSSPHKALKNKRNEGITSFLLNKVIATASGSKEKNQKLAVSSCKNKVNVLLEGHCFTTKLLLPGSFCSSFVCR